MKIYLKTSAINVYRTLLFFGMAVFLLSNVYFGWNKTAQSNAEKLFDFIWQVSLFIGSFGYSVTLIIRDEIDNITFYTKK